MARAAAEARAARRSRSAAARVVWSASSVAAGGDDVGTVFGRDGDEDEGEPPGECVTDVKPGPEVSLIL